MSADRAAGTLVDHVLVCHREPLVAAATAALVDSSGIARHVGVVDSTGQLLSRLGRMMGAIAVVFDSIGEDVSDLFEAMKYRGLQNPVLIVTANTDARHAATVLEAGAAGIISARGQPAELLTSILDAKAGRVVIPGAQRQQILEALRGLRKDRLDARRQLARLSPADIRILRFLCDGLTVARISERLLLSPHTIRGHVRAIGAAIGSRGQLGIAATGRQLLAAAKLPASDAAATGGPLAG